MFDFYWMVAIAAVPAMLYLGFIAPRLLKNVPDAFSQQEHAVFESELHLTEDSSACGKTLAEILETTQHAMNIRRIVRGAGLELSRLPSAVLEAGDRSTIQGTAPQIKEFENILGAQLHAMDEAEQMHLA